MAEFDYCQFARVLMARGKPLEAEKVLEQALRKTPDRDDLIQLLGLLYRKSGRLRDAERLFVSSEAKASRNPMVRFFSDSFGGAKVELAFDKQEFTAAPFVLLHDFLPEDRLEALRNTAFSENTGYRPPDEARRAYERCYDIDEVRGWFLPLLLARLPSSLPRLALEPFPLGEQELKLTVYRRGHFFQAHSDCGSPETLDRRVSFVYYFHLSETAFREGHLLLYDTSPKAMEYLTDAFTRIIPTPNTLILFPSIFYHEVTRIEADNDSLECSRLTLNGHFRERTKSGV